MKRQEQLIKYFNDGARDLRELAEGDIVRMRPFRSSDKVWKKATVRARLDERSYTVETPDGGVYCRTRSHLRKTPERAENASNHDNKGVEKRMRSSGGQNSLSEPAVSLPTPKESEQQQQTSEPPKTVALSPAQPAPVNNQPARPQRSRRPPGYLKDFVCK